MASSRAFDAPSRWLNTPLGSVGQREQYRLEIVLLEFRVRYGWRPYQCVRRVRPSTMSKVFYTLKHSEALKFEGDRKRVDALDGSGPLASRKRLNVER